MKGWLKRYFCNIPVETQSTTDKYFRNEGRGTSRLPAFGQHS